LFWVFVLALSRGGYIGFAVGLLVFLIALKAKKIFDWRKIGATFGITIVALVLSYASVKVSSGQMGIESFGNHAIVAQGTGEEASASPRLERFKEAIFLFREHPLFGVGVGGFGKASRFPAQPDGGYEIVNNQYLEALAETGLVGFITLLGVGFTIVIVLIQRIKLSENPIVPIVFLSSFLAIATQYNFYSTIYILHIWALFGLIDASLMTKEK
jgi:O-antigen ligase